MDAAGEADRDESEEFLDLCVQLKYLGEDDRSSLREFVASHPGDVVQAAAQRGLLTLSDIDIVQSIQHPTRIVPGYRIEELIGRGGMGVVYKAEQIDLERTVALKTILVSNVSDPLVIARFEREAKAVARLQHPNIVQAHNFGKHEGRYYFAMEYVPGKTCEQAVANRPMGEKQAWSIVRQVASGLMHAQSQNLIHRDIKPANLILLPSPSSSADASPTVKITDFGLAMLTNQSSEQNRLTTGEKIVGSPAYMSLEQFSGKPVDYRSDIYSLGATAWHLLFGEPPFDGVSLPALYKQKMEPLNVDRNSLPRRLDDDQWQLLSRMLSCDLSERPQSYPDLIDWIDALAVLQRDSKAASGESRNVANIETQTLPRSISQTTVKDSRDVAANLWWRRGIIVTAIGIAALLISFLGNQSKHTPQGPRRFTRVVGGQPLFDGVTLRGWDVDSSMVGAWNTDEAPDASTAIACTTPQGALTRRIASTENPRISLFVWLASDQAGVDIDFAIDTKQASDQRGSLRITSESIELGRKRTDFGDFRSQHSILSPKSLRDRYHVVDIERQPSDWYVYFEEKKVGTIPIEQVGPGDAIRLVVRDLAQDTNAGSAATPSAEYQSAAFFADAELYELQPELQPEPAPVKPAS